MMKTPKDSAVLFLAPMEGISDFLVRDQLSALGAMDLCVTEFIRVAHHPLPAEVFLRECPELANNHGRTPAGTPVIVQLLGGDPALVAESAATACELGALGIDLNFGCPAKRVNGSDGGAALLKEPHRLTAIISAVRAACPKHVTVSAKIRLGWENPDDVVASAIAAEQGGAEWLTIHARTKMQMYKPHADWTRIALAMRHVKIPVVANGDLFTPDHVARCKEITGATSFMLGRGAFRTPNLFRWIRGLDDAPWPLATTIAFLEKFVASVLAAKCYDKPERAALNRLKGWTNAISEADPDMAILFETLKRAQKLEDAMQILTSGAGATRTSNRAA